MHWISGVVKNDHFALSEQALVQTKTISYSILDRDPYCQVNVLRQIGICTKVATGKISDESQIAALGIFVMRWR